jgi:hypothetical protein
VTIAAILMRQRAYDAFVGFTTTCSETPTGADARAVIFQLNLRYLPSSAVLKQAFPSERRLEIYGTIKYEKVCFPAFNAYEAMESRNERQTSRQHEAKRSGW